MKPVTVATGSWRAGAGLEAPGRAPTFTLSPELGRLLAKTRRLVLTAS